MEKIEFLPLGSIVIIRGGVKKTMIIARGLAVAIQSENKVFDYAGCLYPEGLIGDQVLYFNHADIAKVVFEGYHDEDNDMMVENINAWLEKTPFERGKPLELNQQNHAKTAAEKSV